MWASASLSMTEAQFAVYPAGSQVMRRGDKAAHSAHKRRRALGKCVAAFKAVRINMSKKRLWLLYNACRGQQTGHFGPRLDTLNKSHRPLLDEAA